MSTGRQFFIFYFLFDNVGIFIKKSLLDLLSTCTHFILKCMKIEIYLHHFFLFMDDLILIGNDPSIFEESNGS